MLPITVTNKMEAAVCPIRNILSRVTGKWQILILLCLEDGALRFGEIKRTVGDVTQRVLTENLRSLERDGYLTRTVHEGPPLAVSYSLTERGRSLVELIRPLVHWAVDRLEDIKKSRSDFDTRAR